MPTTSQLEALLNALLAAQPGGAEEPQGVITAGTGSITRLGFALEPWPTLAAWTAQWRLDGLFLHRAWRLRRDSLPPSIAVLAYHKPFDRTLSIGYNTRLAEELELRDIQPLHHRDGRRAAMLGEIAEQPWPRLLQRVGQVFQGVERSSPSATDAVRRIVVADAMNDWLVRAAAQAGAQVYLTGQWREPAAAAVTATGIGVIATGHQRAERWGLRHLARLLRQRWPLLVTVIAGEASAAPGNRMSSKE